MGTPIDTVRLKTAARPSGIDLPVGPWTTAFEANAGPRYVGQRDWSGGVGMKLLPRAEEETNMAWISTCWTSSGNEVLAGPLRSNVEGTALTAAMVKNFVEEPVNNRLYCTCGSGLYYLSGTSGPTAITWQGTDTKTATHVCLADDRLVVSRGTAALARKLTISTGVWSDDVMKSELSAVVNGSLAWASNPTSGGVACYYYWGAGVGQYCLVGTTQSPITNIIEYEGQTWIFKTDGLYLLIPATTPYAKCVFKFDTVYNTNGRSATVYNRALYFAMGDGLWKCTADGAPQRIPTPNDIETGQIGRVYSIANIGEALLVGFYGWTLIMIEYPAGSNQYWWHYLARHQNKKNTGIHFTANTSLTYPRVYLGYESDSTNNLQYIEMVQGDFRPRQFAASSYIIFPGVFTGPELYYAWLQSINYGTRDCASGRTVAWSYSTTPPSVTTTFTSLGSATTANGFQTLTPGGDVSAALVWLRADIATDSATTSPALDYYSLRYYPRSPTRRTWTFPVYLSLSTPLAPGGRARQISVSENDLVAARNQANPCSISIPSQGLADTKVFVDFRWSTVGTNVRQADVTREYIEMYCREAV